MDISVKKTQAFEALLGIAKALPEFFNAEGLLSIEEDAKKYTSYGAFEGGRMVGFIVYGPINADTIELKWMGVLPELQSRGIGRVMLEESLKDFTPTYRFCEVKTLSESDPYEPYKKTRAFYLKAGFVPIETISPYPGWGNNPCQIFVRFLG